MFGLWQKNVKGYLACCKKLDNIRKLDGKYVELDKLMKHIFGDSTHGLGKICELLPVVIT